jgi:hypothetical protein
MAMMGELALDIARPCRDEGNAAQLARGVGRLLGEMGYAALCEMRVGKGRRVDVIGLNRRGQFAIVEIKVSAADLRADHKWPEYLDYCDDFYFAVPAGFDRRLLPVETGMIVADRYGGAVLRRAETVKMAPATRRVQTVRFARYAANRLRRFEDPPV